MTKRHPGRPKGAKARIFAELSDLTTADFAFLRSALQGLDQLPKLYERFYPELSLSRVGDIRPPAFSVARDQLLNLHQRIVKRASISADNTLRSCADAVQSAFPAGTIGALVEIETWTPQGKESSATVDGSSSANVLSFDEWLQTGQNAEFYGEDEWEERYREYVDSVGPPTSDGWGTVPSTAPSPTPSKISAFRRSSPDEKPDIAASVRALGYLQTVLCADPQPSDRTATWISSLLTERFARTGIHTLRDLQAFISRQGRHWWRGVRNLGPLRAQAIETWFDTHADTLGPITRTGSQWAIRPPLSSAIVPLQGPQSQQPLLIYRPTGAPGVDRPVDLVARYGIAPLELLRVPPSLDGRMGTFRLAGVNSLGADTDYEAVCAWLRSYLAAGKLNTFRAYRREVERFYLWCVLIARVPLSSVTTEHANAYRAFLQNVPATFVGNDRVAREDPAWRPFRGPLSARSQAYALGVIGQFYTAMVRSGYCATQPFGLVRTGRGIQQPMDTTRSLSDRDLQWLREELAARADADRQSPDSDQPMFTRRLRVMLQLALQSGMRLDEMASASTRDLRPAVIDGIVSDSDWMLRVVGKGQRTRDIPIRRELYELILEHQRDIHAVVARRSENATRLEQMRQRPPLIGVLAAPVGSRERAIGASTELANDNLGLSRAGIYAMLKRFIRRAVRDGIASARREVRVQEQLRNGMVGVRTEERLAAAGLAVRQAQEELAAWERREQISTHWLRHTFATRLLRANRGDDGLKLAQQLLGHASIATTAEYVKQDEADKVRGMRRVEAVNL